MKMLHYSICTSVLALFALMGCVASESGSPGSTAPTVKEKAPVAVTIIDHRPARDTVDWKTIGVEGESLNSSPADREWPGEEIGLIGPIIAMGGSGSKTYISIYDPGGVFIGALYLKEAREDPSRLENLLKLAQARGAIQNGRTLDLVSARRFLDMAIAARQEVKP